MAVRYGCDCDEKIFTLIVRYWTLAFEDFSGEEGEIEYSKRKLDILVDIFARWEMMEIESGSCESQYRRCAGRHP